MTPCYKKMGKNGKPCFFFLDSNPILTIYEYLFLVGSFIDWLLMVDEPPPGYMTWVAVWGGEGGLVVCGGVRH